MFSNKQGSALIFTLFVVIVLISLGSIFILRTVNESKITKIELNSAKGFYIAEAGAQDAINTLDILINTYMKETVNNANPAVVVSLAQTYAVAKNGLAFLIWGVQDSGVPQFTLSGDGTQAEYSQTSINFGNGQYKFDIYVTQKTDPFADTSESWQFPYNYRLEVSSNSGGVSKKLILTGDFTVRVQRDNFAKYALFTNRQTTPGGTTVWFTDKTNFAGPVHTNERFHFAFNPSGTFQSLVEQHYGWVKFYNSGSPVYLEDDHNADKDVPNFLSGFNRGVDEITLSSPTQKQDLVDQALGGQTYSSDGIYVPNDGVALTGGIYVMGNSNITLQVDGSNNPLYTIQQGGDTKNITVDYANNETTIETVGVGSSTYSGIPDGLDNIGTIIYVDGNVENLGGTLQEDTELTISSNDDIVITDNLMYQSYTPASGNPGDSGYIPPSADGSDNLLGLVTWNGDVRIGNSAPDDVNVHATVLSKEGIFQVDDYDDQGVGSRGTATLLGGVITDCYGAFGLFNGSTQQQIAGYGRNFVYDLRMKSGKAPPYFPSLEAFIAFTNDITDKIVWQEGGV